MLTIWAMKATRCVKPLCAMMSVRNHQPKSLFTHVSQLLTFQQPQTGKIPRTKSVSIGECRAMIPGVALDNCKDQIAVQCSVLILSFCSSDNKQLKYFNLLLLFAKIKIKRQKRHERENVNVFISTQTACNTLSNKRVQLQNCELRRAIMTRISR